MLKAPSSLDTALAELLADVHAGKIQLPEFQRSWTWDDNRIKGILASLTQGYPMGALMLLQYGNEDIRFKCRLIEGVQPVDTVPERLILDGQQRLTSIYQAMYSRAPVKTVPEKDRKRTIERYYYLNMKKCLDTREDRFDAVLSIPSDRVVRSGFNRRIDTDLSTRTMEYVNEMFPVNIIFDSNETTDWADGYREHYRYDLEHRERYKAFDTLILRTVSGYKLPVITLDKSTPRDAVCKVFENVNTGGVALTVFELVTAMFASHIDPRTNAGFDLREDWQQCCDLIRGVSEPLRTDVLNGLDESAFLTAITLYTTYRGGKMTTCKRSDVLSLPYERYLENKPALLEGFRLARKFLIQQYVFRQNDLPYTTQLVPLAAVCAVIGESLFNKPQTQRILTRWFWCGILGEMYGSANETRYANDIEDVVGEINGRETPNRTVNAAFFSATRLLSLQTRNSAAYKGIMALIYREGCRDFIKGTTMNLVTSMDGSPDIHHIFPEAHCVAKGYVRDQWNCIVNKTPLLPESNRAIRGDAPSLYSKRILDVAQIDDAQLRARVESHLIDYDAMIRDDFDGFFIARAKRLLTIIEDAMGKPVADRGAEQTIRAFGESLAER